MHFPFMRLIQFVHAVKVDEVETLNSKKKN